MTVPLRSGFRSNGAIVVHRGDRKPATHRGIPTTTPTQTLTDLSYMLPQRAVERALEQAEKLQPLDTTSAGPRLKRIIEDHDFAPTRSELERARRPTGITTTAPGSPSKTTAHVTPASPRSAGA